jgi:hypothetical protein
MLLGSFPKKPVGDRHFRAKSVQNTTFWHTIFMEYFDKIFILLFLLRYQEGSISDTLGRGWDG